MKDVFHRFEQLVDRLEDEANLAERLEKAIFALREAVENAPSYEDDEDKPGWLVLCEHTLSEHNAAIARAEGEDR